MSLLDQSSYDEFGIVVIGRNEGERLKSCLRSLPLSARIVYVDSGSHDGSDRWAREFGAEVVNLDLAIPFTAARARNAGFGRLLEMLPQIRWIQFIDGDCELTETWPSTAMAFLIAHPKIAAVFGRRRERHPDRSVYNQLCDWEWDGPSGETRACGGDVMMRAGALAAAGGYSESLIAGEEPELCVRLRGAGWLVWRLDAEMTWHDAAMTRFRQWWKRTTRSGYAFAEGASLHGAPPERHWIWETRRAWIWGVWLPALCLLITLLAPTCGWASYGIYPIQILRQTLRGQGNLRDRAARSFFQTLGRFPEALGALRFSCDRLLRRQHILIEYK